MAKVYVVSRDVGVEGYSLGSLAFHKKEDAFVWCRGQSESYEVAEVPIFPELPDRPWFQIEPLKEDHANG